ncbi:hypothetical protein ACFXDH_30060 [Streptomyces sp. NPDC059467]|uniref:hypothetical protein n=1 Tax=Streptomyces sp. NPDC059467 TaxID=3346844 RepID=UPI0036C3AB24
MAPLRRRDPRVRPPHGWANLSAQELVRRFREATVRHGYATHGECYLAADDVL